MTNKSFDNLESLVKHAVKDMQQQIHKREMVIKDIMLDNIQENVYDKYSPKRYKRRYGNDGLGDEDNIEIKSSTAKNGLMVKISNDAVVQNDDYPEGTYLDSIIEYGQGGDVDDPNIPAYLKPRPFIEPTEDELRRNKIIEKIIKEIDYIE